MAKRRDNRPIKRLMIHAAKARPPAQRTGHYYGRTTGLNLCRFVDELLYANYRARLTDAELRAACEAEFPRKKDFQTMVMYRSYFNRSSNGQGIGYKLTGKYRLPQFRDVFHNDTPLALPPLLSQIVKPKARRNGGGKRRQLDPLLRCEVETRAVEVATAHFRRQGYTVESHEKDNVGWDLFATRGNRRLRLEVKGLAGGEICVELTPNEYAQSQTWRDSYFVCIVTNALTKPQLAVFGYSPDSGTWQDDRRRTLQIKEIVAARCGVAQR